MKAKHSFLAIPTRRSTTGVVGVCKTVNTVNGKKFPCYVVTYFDDNDKMRKKKFHFKSKAESEVFQEAVAFRKKYEQKLLREYLNSW